MDIKCALRDYLNTELGNKNNSNTNSRSKSNNEDLELKYSNEKLKKNDNKNKMISSYSNLNEKLIPNNGYDTNSRKDNRIDYQNKLLYSTNFTRLERELLDRIRQLEGNGGYVKNKLTRLVFFILLLNWKQIIM